MSDKINNETIKKNKFIKNFKWVWNYIKPEKHNLFFYGLVAVLEGALSIVIPLVSAKIILNITDKAFNQLIYTAIVVFLLKLMMNCLNYFKGYFYQKIHFGTMNRLKIGVTKEILKLEIAELDKTSSGLFMERINNDTREISDVFIELTYWLSNCVSKVGILVTIFIINKYVFVYCLTIALISFIFNRIYLKRWYEINKRSRKLLERQTGLISEIVRGLKDIKVLYAKESVLKQANHRIYETSEENFKLQKENKRNVLINDVIGSVNNLLFLLLGCLLYKKSLLTIPSFVILYNYQDKMNYLFYGVTQLMTYLKSFTLSSERVYEIISDERFKKEHFGSKHIRKAMGQLKFNDVCFSYKEGVPILKNMSFYVNPNETVSFVGKSGVGKTTIFSLITKLYHPNSGSILLDGTDINELDEESIRSNMSIITQNPYIFNFSVKENMLLANPKATFKEIRKACKMACIDDFIMSLEDKYDTVLGEGGLILSGGQKQRLAIARALLTKTEIILLDEATSALDNETQEEIRKAISNMKGEYTILIIAHRLSTVINSDRILVVDDGKIVAEGNHDKLLKTSKLYKSLYEKDFGLDKE